MSESPNAGMVRARLFPFASLNLISAGLLWLLLLPSSPALADKALASILSNAPASQCGITLSCLPPLLANAGVGPGLLSTHSASNVVLNPNASLIGPASCGPAAGGNPCAGSGVASIRVSGGVNLGAGNPINLINGNKYQREDDLPALPGVLGLEIVRHYNSAYSNVGNTTGILGRGWKLSYETDLHVIGNSIQILQADGARIMFSRDGNDSTLCSSPDPANGQLRIVTTAKGHDYLWTWTNGHTLRFDATGKLLQIAAPTGEFVSLLRDAKGLLVQVTDPQGRQLHLTYPSQRSMAAHDRFGGVMAIKSPIGTFRYRYGSAPPKGTSVNPGVLLANLVGMDYPVNSGGRIYHYENALHPTYLTGISIGPGDVRPAIPTIGQPVMPQRIGTYLYDPNGRAVLSVTGTPARLQTDTNGKPLQPARLVDGTGIGQVFLDYSHPGKTILHNSLGQETVYLHAILAGQYRLLEARGAGCARCGEVNVRYRYDQSARLTDTTRLDRNGELIDTAHTEFDHLGRIVALNTTTYWNGRITLSKPGPRYRYQDDASTPSGTTNPAMKVTPPSTTLTAADNATSPTTVARPSVVPGREALTELRYNAFGQILTVTEQGWSPSSTATGEPVVITRTTSYRYALVNGRSLLSDIDGPLPNGPTNAPVDSDVTHLTWDRSGNTVTGLTLPGGRTSTLAYDAAGRIAAMIDAKGQKTVLGYDARGRQVSSTTDGKTHYTRYDGLDNPIELGQTEGDVKDDAKDNVKDNATGSATPSPATSPAASTLSARFGFDLAGRNTWAANALGMLALSQYDTEGKLLQSSTHAAELHQVRHYAYDPAGRLRAQIDERGAVHQIGWNARDLPVVTRNARGIETQYAYDATGTLSSIVEAANTTQAAIQNTKLQFGHNALGYNETVTAPNGGLTKTLRDDFGRVVSIDSADSGLVRRRYDQAGRLIGSTDALGNRATYDYDVQGRSVRQTITSADITKKDLVTTWQYDADKLIAVSYPGQLERYGYDAQQRLTQKIVVLTLNNDTTSTIVTTYGHDKSGQLQDISLADGSTLHYQRDAQQQVTAITRSRIQTSWLRWLVPSQTIVEALESDTIGMKRITYGNGIVGHYQRRTEGVLARIVYRKPVLPDNKTVQASLIGGMLAIPSAYAAQSDQTVTAQLRNKIVTKSLLPGAPSLPAEPQALIDHRYQWDGQGNLLFTQSQQGQHRYTYDAADRLIIAAEVKGPSVSTATSISTLASTSTSTPVSAPALTLPRTRYDRFFYDGTGNRLLSQQDVADQSDLVTGTIKTSYLKASSRRQQTGATEVVAYDANGEPRNDEQQRYEWDAVGRLVAVHRHGQQLASYRYNHKGERIAKQVAVSGGTTTRAMANTSTNKVTITSAERAHTQSRHYLYEDRKLVAELNEAGQIVRHYVYLADQPVAMIDTPEGVMPDHGQSSFLKKIRNDVATILRRWMGERETLSFLHVNHLGATELVTDATGRPVWQADYGVYGKIVKVSLSDVQNSKNAPGFTFNLRLPGQYEDVETGLYYNDHRYYDPQSGRYLTPDPLGLRGGINSYAYVANNPLKYVDPSGLILFAFDGTGNSVTPASSDSLSNVRKFYEAYFGIPGREKFYITGIGTVDENMTYAGNMITGDGFNQRVQLATNFLDILISDSSLTTTINLDVVGFSRGAAEARVWVNKISQEIVNNSYKSKSGQIRCINFRFEGLWDTVPHLGLTNGQESQYNFSIPLNVRYAAQAVALNEHRGGAGNFNFRSINVPSGESPINRIERGFIGSHADIGGGYGTGDISDVTLVWMIQQASNSGLGNLINRAYVANHGWDTVSSPIIHDKSGNNLFPREGITAEDRDVQYINGVISKQKRANFVGLTTLQTWPFIDYLVTNCDLGFGGEAGESPEVGNIKMANYSTWLKLNYGLNISYNNSGRQACSAL